MPRQRDVPEPDARGRYTVDDRWSVQQFLDVQVRRWKLYGWDGREPRHGQLTFASREAWEKFGGVGRQPDAFDGVPVDVASPVFPGGRSLYDEGHLGGEEDLNDYWGHRPLLLVGETGTGKSQLAALMARLRQMDASISVNLAAESPERLEANFKGTVRGAFTDAVDRQGLLERADGGCLFLDEIESVGQPHQTMLLSWLNVKGAPVRFERMGTGSAKGQTQKHARIWFLLGTNVEPRKLIKEGRLREDLSYRVTQRLDLPPLRDRIVAARVQGERNYLERVVHFIGEMLDEPGVDRYGLHFPFRVYPDSPGMEAITGYGFPGNLRELAGIVAEYRELFTGRRHELTTPSHAHQLSKLQRHLEAAPTQPPAADERIDMRWFVRRLFAQEKGSHVAVARALGIDVRTLRKRTGAGGDWAGLASPER